MLLKRTTTEPQDVRPADFERYGRSDSPCPSPEFIVRHVLGGLSRGQAKLVGSHLEHCPYCNAETEALTIALESTLPRNT